MNTTSNSYIETLKDIEFIKLHFLRSLCEKLDLIRVSAPLIVESNSGINDDLNGTERKVTFSPKCNPNVTLEIVQSLAKWKRIALKKYNIDGLVADMNAIRQDEALDNLHSLYVDQWDWEHVITDRSIYRLYDYADNIFYCVKYIDDLLSQIHHTRPYLFGMDDMLYKISTVKLAKLYPELTPKEREYKIVKLHKAVLLTHIGDKLCNYDSMINSNEKHDLRAPDYDDWNINGDILVWHEPTQEVLELSSMGVRVNKESLTYQLKETNTYEDKKDLLYHKLILNEELPQTIGGGIGQSRLCMFLLRKKHIGEVQSSYWNNEYIKNGL